MPSGDNTMTNLIRSSLALAAIATAAAITGCSTGDMTAFVPLQQVDMNTNYQLNSSANVAGIAAFVGPINNSAPHASMGDDYYSDVTATLSISPNSGVSPCSSQSVQMTGKLTNVKDGVVMMEMTGDLAGGTVAISGEVRGYKQAAEIVHPQIVGSYSIDGGSCSVQATNFIGMPVAGGTSTTVTTKH